MSACAGLHTKIVTFHRNRRVAAGQSVSQSVHLGSGAEGPGISGGTRPLLSLYRMASLLCSPVSFGASPIHGLIAAPPLSFGIGADDEAFHQGRRASQHFGVSASSFRPLHLSRFLFIFLFISGSMVVAMAAAADKCRAPATCVCRPCLIHLLSAMLRLIGCRS